MTILPIRASLLATAVLLAACGADPQPADVPPAVPASGPTPVPATDPGLAVDPAPADQFLARIAQHCGQAFAGRIVANEPPPAEPDAFEGKALVMHVRDCAPDVLRIPFHVGDDHSRTWVITRTADGLRLKHDHRHEDGSPDAVTMYGGDTAAPGSAERQEFPVDAESIATFEREGLSASVTNTWAIEIDPGQQFVYELSRPGGRLFKVVFDLTAPVELPPAPWGSETP
jgi:hypothetical protein